jgi:hypothetical protein
LGHRCRVAAPLLGLGVLWSAACSGVGPSDTSPLRKGEPPPAVLAFYGDTSTVELPDSARVGETVTLRVSTFGGSCVRPGEVGVVISELHAEVRPYLEEPPKDLPPTTVCTAELRIDWRVAHLRFDQPGRASIRIVGLAEPEERPFAIDTGLYVAP